MRHRRSGRFELDLEPDDAIGLFTPEGERRWVPGWDPAYPAGTASESPGTVFMTEAHGATTIWVILDIDRELRGSAYARVTPGHHAGTVRVRCSDLGGGRCEVEVGYDMSLLPGADPADMHGYETDAFQAMLAEWKALIETAQRDA